MNNNGVAGYAGCTRAPLSVRKMRKTAIFAILKDSAQLMATGDHFQCCIWFNIDKQCMKYICVRFGASTVLHKDFMKDSLKSHVLHHFWVKLPPKREAF